MLKIDFIEIQGTRREGIQDKRYFGPEKKRFWTKINNQTLSHYERLDHEDRHNLMIGMFTRSICEIGGVVNQCESESMRVFLSPTSRKDEDGSF